MTIDGLKWLKIEIHANMLYSIFSFIIFQFFQFILFWIILSYTVTLLCGRSVEVQLTESWYYQPNVGKDHGCTRHINWWFWSLDSYNPLGPAQIWTFNITSTQCSFIISFHITSTFTQHCIGVHFYVSFAFTIVLSVLQIWDWLVLNRASLDTMPTCQMKQSNISSYIKLTWFEVFIVHACQA